MVAEGGQLGAACAAAGASSVTSANGSAHANAVSVVPLRKSKAIGESGANITQVGQVGQFLG